MRELGAIMRIFLLLIGWVFSLASAQAQPLAINTVERPPFAINDGGHATGFSIDLMNAIAKELGTTARFTFKDSFAEMLNDVETGKVDAAIANISITAAREAVMDFSQPIFESGLQILTHSDARSASLWDIIKRGQILNAIGTAFALLFILGMIMWLVERKRQPYFDRPLKEAIFPSFWWSLNLVVNGGFEERMPQSILGRFIGVLMVISSLFIVSLFVARITTVMTIDAIEGNIEGLNDLDGRRVATTEGSTSSELLSRREIDHTTYSSFNALITGFENGTDDVILFDGPILAYYVQSRRPENVMLLQRSYKPENYGIALPSDSTLQDQIDVALLKLRENGSYDKLMSKWFGNN